MTLVVLMGRTQCKALDQHQTAKISACGYPSDVICPGAPVDGLPNRDNVHTESR